MTDQSKLQEMQTGPDHIGEANEKVTADHAELARRLRVSWSDRGWVASNKIKEILGEAREAADALETLLSEIAALRLALEAAQNADAENDAHLRSRATQAERQRDELRKALEKIERISYADSDEETVARQALANQGAD